MDVSDIRRQFPILERQIHGKPLIYFDSANTAQKPLAVIDAVDDFYRRHNANVARAVHTLSEEATSLYEAARERIAGFIGAGAAREVVLTSGTTMAINLVALECITNWSLSKPTSYVVTDWFHMGKKKPCRSRALVVGQAVCGSA